MRYPAHVAVGDHPDVLRRIREPGINLAIWERPLSLELKRSVAHVAAGISTVVPLFGFKLFKAVPAAQAWEEFSRALPPELCTLDAGPLRADMRACTRLFSRTVRPEYLTPSWRVERRDRRWTEDWHHDSLRYRLLCIYWGATTLGLDNRDAIKVPDNPLAYRRRRFARIWRLPLGAVCIFKGVDGAHLCPPFVHSEPPGSDLRLLNVLTD